MASHHLQLEDTGDFAAALRSRLAQCSSVFQRLMYLGSFKNPATGVYSSPTGPLLPKEHEEIVRRYHRDIFEHWLSLSLIEQHDDLAAYLDSIGHHARRILVAMIRVETASQILVPDGALPEQRALFHNNLKALLRAVALGPGE